MFILEQRQIPQQLAQELLEYSWDLEQHHLTMYGRRIPFPRLMKWYGPIDYHFSGIILRKDTNYPDPLLTLFSLVKEVTPTDCCLINYYRSGNDSVSMHADDEPLFDNNASIVGVSVGVTRTFITKNNTTNTKNHYKLTHGSVVIMPPGYQLTHQHEVPKEPKINGQRINFTFRKLIGA